MRRNSGIIGPKQTISQTSATGTFDTFDNYNAVLDNTWPEVKKFVSVSPNSGNVNEGASTTFTVTTDGKPVSAHTCLG